MVKIKKKSIKKKATKRKTVKKKVSRKRSIKSKKATKAKIKKKVKKGKATKKKSVKAKKTAKTKKRIKKKKVIKRKTRGKTIKSKGVKKKVKTTLKIMSGKEFKEIEQMLLSQRAELLRLISKSVAWEKDISKLERGDIQDMAATSLEREMTFAMGSREREEFLMINSALRKIAKRTYGKCESCGERINIKRLKIVPFAQYCMECKSIMEHEIEPESEEPFS